jgi:uncharacterized protein (TIGR02001 family)
LRAVKVLNDRHRGLGARSASAHKKTRPGKTRAFSGEVDGGLPQKMRRPANGGHAASAIYPRVAEMLLRREYPHALIWGSTIRGRVMALGGVGRALLSSAALLVTLPVGAGAASDKSADAKADDPLKFEIETVLTSDYIYRGVSLSSRQPSVGASIDVEWHKFYIDAEFRSVKLPTQPAAEITLSTGYRWSLWDTDFDLGASYYYYPGEILTDAGTKTNYWEYGLQAARQFNYPGKTDTGVTLTGSVAYAPDVSATGAWGVYVEGEAAVDLPQFNLSTPIDWQLIVSAGRWRFGDTSPAQGGFPLPSYTNWRVALEFTLKEHFTLGLNYYDTSLSREDCFVFTGDLMATPGGAVNPISNPDGLMSRLCGATFVATLKASIDVPKK